jgi:hypothetical protein
VKLLLELVRAFLKIIGIREEAYLLPRSVSREASMADQLKTGPVVHIRFEGRSFDIPLSRLDLGRLSTDPEIKRALARHLEVSELRLRDYVVDRHETGNLTVRPEAVFG